MIFNLTINITSTKESKLSNEEIDGILSKWVYMISTEFLKHAKDGALTD